MMMDIIPSDLATPWNEAKNFMQESFTGATTNRIFLLTFLVVNMADCQKKQRENKMTFSRRRVSHCTEIQLPPDPSLRLSAGSRALSSVPIGKTLSRFRRSIIRLTASAPLFLSRYHAGAAFSDRASPVLSNPNRRTLSNNMIL